VLSKKVSAVFVRQYTSASSPLAAAAQRYGHGSGADEAAAGAEADRHMASPMSSAHRWRELFLMKNHILRVYFWKATAAVQRENSIRLKYKVLDWRQVLNYLEG
jgi:hypothetical protein